MEWAEACFPLARDGQDGCARDTVRDYGPRAAGLQLGRRTGQDSHSPIAKVRKPGRVQRDVCLMPGQWEQLLAAVKTESFRDFLVACGSRRPGRKRFDGSRPATCSWTTTRLLDLAPEKVKGGERAESHPWSGRWWTSAGGWRPSGRKAQSSARKGKPWNRSPFTLRLWRLERATRFPGLHLRHAAHV